jgi:hypothetical protein
MKGEEDGDGNDGKGEKTWIECGLSAIYLLRNIILSKSSIYIKSMIRHKYSVFPALSLFPVRGIGSKSSLGEWGMGKEAEKAGKYACSLATVVHMK